MTKASTVYLWVFVVFTMGIWLIIEMGNLYLTPPRDISGTWRLTDEPATRGSASFSIHQSGKYVRFAPEKGEPVDLVLQKTETANDAGGLETMTFNGEGWQVIAACPSVGNVRFTFQPPQAQDGWTGTYRHPQIDVISPAAPRVKAASPK